MEPNTDVCKLIKFPIFPDKLDIEPKHKYDNIIISGKLSELNNNLGKLSPGITFFVSDHIFDFDTQEDIDKIFELLDSITIRSKDFRILIKSISHEPKLLSGHYIPDALYEIPTNKSFLDIPIQDIIHEEDIPDIEDAPKGAQKIYSEIKDKYDALANFLSVHPDTKYVVSAVLITKPDDIATKTMNKIRDLLDNDPHTDKLVVENIKQQIENLWVQMKEKYPEYYNKYRSMEETLEGYKKSKKIKSDESSSISNEDRKIIDCIYDHFVDRGDDIYLYGGKYIDLKNAEIITTSMIKTFMSDETLKTLFIDCYGVNKTLLFTPKGNLRKLGMDEYKNKIVKFMRLFVISFNKVVKFLDKFNEPKKIFYYSQAFSTYPWGRGKITPPPYEADQLYLRLLTEYYTLWNDIDNPNIDEFISKTGDILVKDNDIIDDITDIWNTLNELYPKYTNTYKNIIYDDFNKLKDRDVDEEIETKSWKDSEYYDEDRESTTTDIITNVLLVCKNGVLMVIDPSIEYWKTQEQLILDNKWEHYSFYENDYDEYRNKLDDLGESDERLESMYMLLEDRISDMSEFFSVLTLDGRIILRDLGYINNEVTSSKLEQNEDDIDEDKRIEQEISKINKEGIFSNIIEDVVLDMENIEISADALNKLSLRTQKYISYIHKACENDREMAIRQYCKNWLILSLQYPPDKESVEAIALLLEKYPDLANEIDTLDVIEKIRYGIVLLPLKDLLSLRLDNLL